MCGVFGWATPRPAPEADRWLDAASAALGHRGPDGAGRWRARTRDGGEIALLHRRLALVDPAGGAQPFTSGDGRYVVSFNGEVYNHVELREELRGCGCRFRTGADTEVLIEAWRVWGEDALPRLRGMFAFALYDKIAQRLTLARDRFGKKPLHLMATMGGLAFASEPQALLSLPGAPRRFNVEALPDLLLRRYVPGDRTLFEGVRRLTPGTVATLSKGRFIERRWARPPLAEVRPRAADRAAAEAALAQTLETAVRLRLRADAPAGVFLSGGLDSSTIAALAARHVSVLRTYAAGFAETGLSEAPHAARVAERLGARHETLIVSPEAFARRWPDAVRARGAPVGEASDIPLLMLAETASAAVKIALTGEGADEVFYGYPKHRAERWTPAYHALIGPAAHRRLVEPLVRRLPLAGRRARIAAGVLGEGDPAARAVLWFANGSPAEIAALCGRAPGVDRCETAGLSSLRAALLTDQSDWLANNLLERGDRMLIAAGVEGRAPFLDAEVAALAARIPDALHFDGRGGKALVRGAARSWLDAETLGRRKAGFRTPVGDWFRGPLRPMLDDLLRAPEAAVRRLLVPAEIDRRLAEHGARRVDHTAMLWTIANLELFMRAHRMESPV